MANHTTTTQPLYPTSDHTTTAPPTNFLDFLANNLWVPVVFGLLFIVSSVLTFYYICKRRRCLGGCGNYGYTRINSNDLLSSVKIDASRIKEQVEIRDAALLNCSFYLRNTGSYSLIDHLPDMGSRLGKQWFLVLNSRSRREQLLTLVKKSPQMSLSFTNSTQKTLVDLFSIIKHPYILPVTHVDFVREHELVIVIMPFCQNGSLKDLLYACDCNNAWQQKYYMKKKGLSLQLIQLYGKQILEALIYLHTKGFPPHLHLHNGNVLVQNNTCRLTAVENSLLGLQSKMFPLIRKKVKDNRDPAIDSLCFGHMMYELAAGGELSTAHPQPRELLVLSDTHPPLVKLLEFIFDSSSGDYPSVTQIADHYFFQDVILKDMVQFNSSPIHFNKDMKQLLKSVCLFRHERPKTKQPTMNYVIKPAPKPTNIKSTKSKRSKPKSPGITEATSSPPVVEMGSLGHQGYHKFTEVSKGNPSKRKASSEDIKSPPTCITTEAGGGRGALLEQIRQGKTLKKSTS